MTLVSLSFLQQMLYIYETYAVSVYIYGIHINSSLMDMAAILNGSKVHSDVGVASLIVTIQWY